MAKVNAAGNVWTGWSASVPADVAPVDVNTNPAQGATYPLAAVGDGTSQLENLGGGGRFKGGGLALDITAPGGSGIIPCQPFGNVIRWTSGLGMGSLQDAGAFSLTTNVEFVVVTGERVEGLLVPATGFVEVRRDDTNAVAGSGSVSSSGRFVTGAPYIQTVGTPPAYTAKPSADPRYNMGPSDPSPLHIPVGQLHHARRIFQRWHVTESGEPGPLAIDSPRQWLHRAEGKRIVTYPESLLAMGPSVLSAATSAGPLFQSEEHPVEAWLALVYDERRATLYGAARLPKEDGETRGRVRVYRSRNGGQTITEELTMTARTMAVERDSVRRVLVLIFEDEGNISRRIMPDDAATWTDAETVLLDGAVSGGEVLNLAQDDRAAGILWLSAKVGGNGKLYRSRDLGKTWTSVLA